MEAKINFGSPSAFEFSKSFDTEYLKGLYDNDLVWVEDIFATVLNTYEQDVAVIAQRLSENNLEDLRKAIHKIKPSYGFVGLLPMQQRCQLVEDKCKNASSIDDVKGETQALIAEAERLKAVITTEYKRLKEFNNPPS